jgi:hypothetical protein
MSDLLIERLGGTVKHTNIVMRQYGTSLAGKVWLFHRGSPSGEDEAKDERTGSSRVRGRNPLRGG